MEWRANSVLTLYLISICSLHYSLQQKMSEPSHTKGRLFLYGALEPRDEVDEVHSYFSLLNAFLLELFLCFTLN